MCSHFKETKIFSDNMSSLSAENYFIWMFYSESDQQNTVPLFQLLNSMRLWFWGNTSSGYNQENPPRGLSN